VVEFLHIVGVLLVLVRLFSHLPNAASRTFARILNSATVPFDLVNYLGSCVGGMHYPVRWGPFFTDFMTLEDMYHFPTKHLDFHARQLTLRDPD